ncbi:Notch-regulated ankyrin repeat-containing protein [Halotydeus destructor]|nr:Notch-regulated ankyrin repeat-containing protein [Halotydeus destructor]
MKQQQQENVVVWTPTIASSMATSSSATFNSVRVKKEPKEKSCCPSSMSTAPVAANLVSQSNCDRMNSDPPPGLADLTNRKKDTARELLAIIRKGNYGELLDLLRSKPDLNVYVNGQTALHYCLLLGRDVSWLKQLVTNGANPNLSNLDGWHPMHLAAFTGHQETLTYLITCNSRATV